jgi:CDGSH-type Zn-finger protein
LGFKWSYWLIYQPIYYGPKRKYLPQKAATEGEDMPDPNQKITVQSDGPLIVHGGIPLARKSPVMSEHGEPLTWQKEGNIRSPESYALCRCGRTGNKLFCDDSHEDFDFDGSEAANPGPIAEREDTYAGTKITMKNDRSLCMHAGFCGNRITNVWKMIHETEDTQVRAQLMAMIERCPSGALSFTIEPEGAAVEPDLPAEVAVTPDGPLWVSGGITVEMSNGQTLEARNRVTLCRCGASKIKPLCDGAHKDIGYTAP